MQEIRPFADNFIPIIPVDDKQHSQEHPFCFANPSCPCHEDNEAIAEIHAFVQAGLLTPTEATRTIEGKMLTW